MAKVCTKQFPMGSFPHQQSAGFYFHKALKENVDIMVKSIGKDMQFVGIISGKGTVRSGKTTLSQQCGTYFTDEVNKRYKVKNKFTVDNIVFKGEDLIEKAMVISRYSVLVLDEGDDLTMHYWRDLSQRLRRFFRKCGQLNLFILLIIPDFFELPRHYAVTRTNFLINVYFYGEFQRGYFEFYSGKRKRDLYFKGRKYADYGVVHPDFDGRFLDLYTVDKEEYLKRKREDLEKENVEEDRKQPSVRIMEVRIKVCIKLSKLYKFKPEEIAKVLEVEPMTVYRYLKAVKEGVFPKEFGI